jgi:hypothetical protein
VTPAVERTGSIADRLNDTCQCIWVDRSKLGEQLRARLGPAGEELESRPGLVSGSVVFVAHAQADAMDRATALITRALRSEAFDRVVADAAPDIARARPVASEGVLGFDFHLGGGRPQLIEINTNPGGLLVNVELARAISAMCDCLDGPAGAMAAGAVDLEAVETVIEDRFAADWRSARPGESLRTIAIVDDDPSTQYLHPEFLLFRALFERVGWRTVIADPRELAVHDRALFHGATRIDLVYNRVTDFYLTQREHGALRQAYEQRLAVVTPHPAAHARWADKRLLAWLRDEQLLERAGLGPVERGTVLESIPPTEIVDRDRADDLWQRRKRLFFKPTDGFGGRAAYRGDKLTRRAFEQVLANGYVAQEFAPTSLRRVSVDGDDPQLRTDLRNYVVDGVTLLRAARLYRGQTTNFRTPGGGFAPVLQLPT